MNPEQFKPAGDRPPSAEAPERSSLPAGEAAETEQLEGELRALRRMLFASQGTFSLSLAICNSPALRDRLIEQVSSSHPGVRKIAVPAGTVDVLGYVRQEMRGQPAAALCIVDCEKSLPSDAQDWPTLRSLNASRELWAKEFPLPVTFWLPSYAATLLARYARDLWRWFSHQFEFVADEAQGAASPGLMGSSSETDISNLDADRKHLRIVELQQRIQEAWQSDDPLLMRHVSRWLQELGLLHYHLGNLDQAEHALLRAVEVDLKLGSLEGMANDYGNLGIVYKTRGDLEQAEKMYRQSLEINQKLGSLEGMAIQYTNLGILCETRGDITHTREMWSKALELYRRIGAATQIRKVEQWLKDLPVDDITS